MPAATPLHGRDSEGDSSGGASKDNVELQYLPVSTTEQAHTPTEREDGNHVPGYKLSRFPFRALILIVIPPLVLAYFVVLKTTLLSEDPEIIPYGHRNAKWVYYSWFFIGVFGLSVSKYGLEGIEAAMVQDPFWAPKDGLVLFSHAEKTWTGLSGWWALLKGTVKTKGRKRFVGRLWALLSMLSLAIYIGLPLSGLAMELFDGYVKSSGHPKVLGRTPDTFNMRYGDLGMVRSNASWRGGASMTLPGIGVLYTSPDFDRGEHDELQSFPNSLPQTDGIMDMFIAPQATTLVEGRAWGLRLGYKCDIATSSSNFTLLSQRWSKAGQTWDPKADQSDRAAIITSWNSGRRLSQTNTWAYGEAAHNLGDKPGGLWRNASSFDEEGLEAAGNIIEIVLWQMHSRIAYHGAVDINFNETAEPPIADLGGPFFFDPKSPSNITLNSTFFPKEILNSDVNLTGLADPFDVNWMARMPILAVAKPIGIRCLHQYDRGFADLDPESATYTSFESAEPRPNGMADELEFGRRAIYIIQGSYLDMYSPSARGSYSNEWWYRKYIDPQHLARSMMRAYAMDALQLMYDGSSDFSDAYEHENLTSTKEGKILGPGEVPVEAPLVLFAIWAAGCMYLGVMYGFRPRWAETLNGFSMFCLGGDFGDEIRETDIVMHKDYADSEGLGRIPGMVGDGRRDPNVGRLTLVDRTSGQVVNRRKFYE